MESCPKCGKEFKSTLALRMHNNRVHSKKFKQAHREGVELAKSRTTCPECGKTFKNEHGYLAHHGHMHGLKSVKEPEPEPKSTKRGHRPKTVGYTVNGNGATPLHAITLAEAINGLEVKRDLLNEVIQNLRLMLIGV